MLADYARLRITRHPVWPYHPRIWELRHNLGADDAAYIALAEALGCELLTGDVKLKNATGHRGSDRLPLASRRGSAAEPAGSKPGPFRVKFLIFLNGSVVPLRPPSDHRSLRLSR
jgi:hypothetical protein